MNSSTPMSIQRGCLKLLAVLSAWTFTTMRSSVWRQQSASMLSGIIPSKSSKSATTSSMISTCMRAIQGAASGEETTSVMASFADNMMNVNQDAVAPSCRSHTIDVCQSLATTAQAWTIQGSNTRTEIITTTGRTI